MRFFSFGINDLIIEPETIAEALRISCNRQEILRPQSIIQLRDEFTVIAVPAVTPIRDLQFQCLQNPTREELSAVADERWRGGYDIVGAVTLPESGEVMVLFQR